MTPYRDETWAGLGETRYLHAVTPDNKAITMLHLLLSMCGPTEEFWMLELKSAFSVENVIINKIFEKFLNIKTTIAYHGQLLHGVW